MFIESITYPRSGTDAVKTILIGGILTLFGFLLVPLVLVAGYTVRIVRDVLAHEEQPAAFEKWGDLFVDGIKAIVITIVYFAIPTVVLVGTVVLALLSFDQGLSASIVSGSIALVGLLVAGVLYLVCWYVATAGFVNFAKTGRLAAAFALGELRPILTSGSFATAWVLALGVLLVGSVVSGVLEFLPFGLGFVLSAFVAFYVTISMSYLYARGFADATAVEPDSEEVAGQLAV